MSQRPPNMIAAVEASLAPMLARKDAEPLRGQWTWGVVTSPANGGTATQGWMFVPDEPAARNQPPRPAGFARPQFIEGAAAFALEAASGAQTIMAAVLNARNVNGSEMLAHAADKLKSLAESSLKDKQREPAVAACMGVLHGALALIAVFP